MDWNQISVVFAGNMVYWPLWLAGLGGVLLLVIAVMALLLLKGHPNPSEAEKQNLPKIPKTGQRQTAAEAVAFFRIGPGFWEKTVTAVPECWISVGSDTRTGFCLDSEDSKLERQHFQICLTGNALLVSASEGETFANGVPIRYLGNVSLRSGDLIRAGSHEYRVIFPVDREKEKEA